MTAREVVQVEEIAPGVVELTLLERAARNAFTPALMAGLTAAFEALRGASGCRAVVLTGHDSWFASGGTREGLLAMQEGRASFTDTSFYALPLACEVPVVAAMQGHAIGGGLVLGLFSDVVVLARESVYTANFMEFGFTPGMGATCVVPRKLGLALGQELLLTGATFRGAELERRGVPFAVLPRAEVLARGRDLARQLAEKPRDALVRLKAHLTAELRRELPAVIEREAAMQEVTFRHPEVRARILERLGERGP